MHQKQNIAKKKLSSIHWSVITLFILLKKILPTCIVKINVHLMMFLCIFLAKPFCPPSISIKDLGQLGIKVFLNKPKTINSWWKILKEW